jgi:hypothetical protein
MANDSAANDQGIQMRTRKKPARIRQPVHQAFLRKLRGINPKKPDPRFDNFDGPGVIRFVDCTECSRACPFLDVYVGPNPNLFFLGLLGQGGVGRDVMVIGDRPAGADEGAVDAVGFTVKSACVLVNCPTGAPIAVVVGKVPNAAADRFSQNHLGQLGGRNQWALHNHPLDNAVGVFARWVQTQKRNPHVFDD